ncbi:DUF4255 domain-containing protein [Pyxidicoccus sp. 3LFB2]
MLYDLDRTLKALLLHELPRELLGPDIPISIGFATPDDQFPPASFVLPALNLFLYDVQENVALRSPEARSERQDDGSVLVQRPPAWVDCHYLVTAHARDGAQSPQVDEHLLLGEALQALLRHRRLPAGFLQGRLQGKEPLPRTRVVLPESLRHGAELWSALRGRLRPSFHYTVTMAVELAAPETAGPLVTREGGVQLTLHPRVVPSMSGDGSTGNA